MLLNFPKTQISSKDLNYEIQLATESDKQEIIDFLWKYCFADEPLNKCIAPRDPSTIQSSVKCLDEGLTLKAVHNDKIIGVILNLSLKRGYINEPPLDVKNEDFGKIVLLLDKVAKAADIFSKFPDCDRAIMTKIVSVNSDYRGHGIAKELLARTLKLGKLAGFGFMTLDCTSKFSARAAESLGFDCCFTLKYTDHIVNGENPLVPEAPHDAIRVYNKKIT